MIHGLALHQARFSSFEAGDTDVQMIRKIRFIEILDGLEGKPILKKRR